MGSDADTNALVRVQDTGIVPAGTLAMALLSDAEFAARLAALKRGVERAAQVKRELMVPGAHYGVIPGTDKPTLLKPGAEVLCNLYGLRADFAPAVDYGDGATSPPISVRVRCELHVGDLLGPVVAVGYGSASSWERKHRYRNGERTCPACGKAGAIIKGREEFGGGWLCFAKRGGCGGKWPAGAREIEAQQIGMVENPDQHDLGNTLLKMAEKRAFLDATLRATASSDLFTQDLEDGEDSPQPEHASKAPAPTPQRDVDAGAENGEAAPKCPRCQTARAVVRNRAGAYVCVRSKGGCDTPVQQ